MSMLLFPAHHLPPLLGDSLQAQVISEAEAIDLWLLFTNLTEDLLKPTDQLQEAVDRIALWHMVALGTRH